MALSKLYQNFIFSQNFALLNIFVFLQFYMNSLIHNILKPSSSDPLSKVRYVCFVLIVSLIIGALIKSFCFYTLGKELSLTKQKSWSSFTLSRLSDWMVTEVRIQIRCFLFLLLFIVPGIIEALRLSLAVPFVFYDQRMKDATFDPVLTSRKILKFSSPHFWNVFFFALILPLFPMLLSSSLDTTLSSMSSLFSVFVLSFLTSLVSVLSFSYIILLYSQVSTEEIH